jgi:hypothetical protein
LEMTKRCEIMVHQTVKNSRNFLIAPLTA